MNDVVFSVLGNENYVSLTYPSVAYLMLVLRIVLENTVEIAIINFNFTVTEMRNKGMNDIVS